MVASPSGIEAYEALEHLLSVVRRDAGPVRVHADLDAVRHPRGRHGNPGPGMPRGVVTDVVQHPAEHARVAADPTGAYSRAVHHQVARRPKPPDLVEYEVVDVDR